MNKDLFIKALKTFIQAFLAYLIAQEIIPNDSDDKAIQMLIVGAIASGLSALMNFNFDIKNDNGGGDNV